MFKKNWTWAILGVLALVIRYFAVRSPEKTEEIYSRAFFPVIRNIVDLSLSRFAFPTVYLFLASIFLFLGIYIYYFRKKAGWKKKLVYTLRSASNYAGALVFFFLVFWGYNYQRIPIFQQLNLHPKALDKEELLREITLTGKILGQLRSNVTRDTTALTEIMPYRELEDIVRVDMKENLYLLGLNFTGNPRTKEFYPAGFLRRMGILGIYFPFTGESYIDPTLHALEKPFTIAHEMAHSYGITDEGEANFISWVICTNSAYPILQYSAQLRLFRYQLNDMYRIDQEIYRNVLSTIDKGIKNDLLSIYENSEKIRPIASELSRKSNDIFLKAQGVKAGVKSYAQLPMLAYAWRNRLNDG